eukprot:SAG25_NODE_995_length_4362_cov_17.744312_2_plen_56_part_00
MPRECGLYTRERGRERGAIVFTAPESSGRHQAGDRGLGGSALATRVHTCGQGISA